MKWVQLHLGTSALSMNKAVINECKHRRGLICLLCVSKLKEEVKAIYGIFKEVLIDGPGLSAWSCFEWTCNYSLPRKSGKHNPIKPPIFLILHLSLGTITSKILCHFFPTSDRTRMSFTPCSQSYLLSKVKPLLAVVSC